MDKDELIKGLKWAHPLLNRTPPPDYEEQCGRDFNLEQGTSYEGFVPLLIFRLYQSSFAIETKCLNKIIEQKQVFALPHNNNPELLGLINFDGQIKALFSLHRVMQLSEEGIDHKIPLVDEMPRMISLESDKDFWIFPVDEILGIFPCQSDKIINGTDDQTSLLKGLIKWGDYTSVALIDEEALCRYLRESVA